MGAMVYEALESFFGASVGYAIVIRLFRVGSYSHIYPTTIFLDIPMTADQNNPLHGPGLKDMVADAERLREKRVRKAALHGRNSGYR